jgi:hypothetical protein
MILLGVQDIDSVFPLYGGSAWTNVYASNVGPNETTQVNGPLTLPGGQCFLLAGFGGGGSNQLYTGSSGFNVRGTWPWNNSNILQNTWDQQVCPGSQTTYDFTMTSPTAQGSLESGMWAFGATTNTTWPVISEATGVQFNSGQTSFTLRNQLVGGESITVCAGSSGSGTPTIASTPTLIWTPVYGGGDDYQAWTTTAAPSGNLNIQVGPTSSTFENVGILVNRNVGGLDGSAVSAFSGTGATLNPSITTTQPADFLNSCATSMGSLTDSFALQNDSSWAINQYEPTDFGYVDGWSKLAGAAGSYSANMSFESAQPSSLTIVGYLPSAGPTIYGSLFGGNSQHSGNQQIK